MSFVAQGQGNEVPMAQDSAVKDLLVIKVFIAGQLNTKNTKTTTTAKKWLDATYVDIGVVYKDRIPKIISTS